MSKKDEDDQAFIDAIRRAYPEVIGGTCDAPDEMIMTAFETSNFSHIGSVCLMVRILSKGYDPELNPSVVEEPILDDVKRLYEIAFDHEPRMPDHEIAIIVQEFIQIHQQLVCEFINTVEKRRTQ